MWEFLFLFFGTSFFPFLFLLVGMLISDLKLMKFPTLFGGFLSSKLFFPHPSIVCVHWCVCIWAIHPMLVHVLRCAHTKLVSIVKRLRLCSIDEGYMSMQLRPLLILLSHKLIWKYHLNIESLIFVSLHEELTDNTILATNVWQKLIL